MKLLITTISFLLVSIIGFSQNQEFAKLDSFFTILEENNRFFGSVAVARAGEIIYSKAIGHADLGTKTMNTTETKFRIGSITKTFTATLIMKAVELGKINLNDAIDAYFPAIQNAEKITVRQLLNHRSGIKTFTDREYLSWYTNPITPQDLLEIIVKKGSNFEPNAKHEYSNSNYVLLTFILENIFEKPFPQLLETYIIEPANLAQTSYGKKIKTTQNEALSYRMKTDWEIADETDMSVPLGAGGMVSTPTDLCLFAEALFSGKLISPGFLNQMKPVGEEEYGFALYEMPFNELSGMGHGGDIDAFTSTLAYFEESDLSFALTCNGSNFGKHEVALAVLNEIFGKPYELPSFEFIELSDEEAAQYVGTYETDELPMDMTISREGNQLMLTATGQSASPLKAEGNHKFSIMKYGVKIEFLPSEQKMHFEQQGMAFEFTLKQPDASAKTTTLNLEQYLGTYESDQLPMDLTIGKEDNTLTGQGTGQPAFPLAAESEHVFTNKQIGLKIIFKPNEKKLIFEQGGAEFEMKLEM